mmetsp:Transcript_95433/g.273720  ORF Transcript_95433/g.273720 Transcript_95433/m.273720 type:complete len:202 (-) Transcript_95433:18-623(-)
MTINTYLDAKNWPNSLSLISNSTQKEKVACKSIVLRHMNTAELQSEEYHEFKVISLAYPLLPSSCLAVSKNTCPEALQYSKSRLSLFLPLLVFQVWDMYWMTDRGKSGCRVFGLRVWKATMHFGVSARNLAGTSDNKRYSTFRGYGQDSPQPLQGGWSFVCSSTNVRMFFASDCSDCFDVHIVAMAAAADAAIDGPKSYSR